MRWIGSASARPNVRLRFARHGSIDFDPLVRSIAEQSPDVIMLLDRAGCVRFINRTVPDLSIDEVIGQQVLRYVPPGQREMALDHYERVALTAQPTQFHSDVLRRRRRLQPLVLARVSLRARRSSGRLRRGRARDRARRGAVHGLRTICSSICARTCCACRARTARFERVNLAFERTLGYSRGELARPALGRFRPPR